MMHSGSDLSIREATSNQIIYPATKVSWYVWLLILSKFFRCIGTFIAYDALKTIHVVHFLLLVMVMSSILYGFILKPFRPNIKLKRSVWTRLVKYSSFQTMMMILWFSGLSQVGPLRSNLLTEHSSIAIIAIWTTILKGSGNSSMVRGTVWFIIGVVCLILFDNDVSVLPPHPEGQQHHEIKHLFYYLLSWTGLSDHEGGVFILLLMTSGQWFIKESEQKLTADVGGGKRLHALSSIISSLLLLVLSIIIAITQNGPSTFTPYFIQALVVAIYVFLFNYFVHSACVHRLEGTRTAHVGTLSMLIINFIVSWIWTSVYPSVPATTTSGTTTSSAAIHATSGGVVMAFLMFCYATTLLCSHPPKERWKGTSTGNHEMLPLYGLSAEAYQRSQSMISFIKSTFNHIISDTNSRTIFYFLCLNFSFTCVELGYGMWTNSLGLISDGFHMLFDCSALVMGLTASVMAQWKPSKTFPYGYGRIEVLSGFINGLFLALIGFMVLVEAVGRIIEPPEVRTEKLLLVAVSGLIINIFGILSFSHLQGKHGHSHTAGHPHSHGHSHNANMQGVFLHIVADTMGSIAVIISSLLIDKYGWNIADPICSFVLAILILTSVIPLLTSSIKILLLKAPETLMEDIQTIINKILDVEGVVHCNNPRFWQHTSDINVANVQLACIGQISEQKIIQKVTTLLQEHGFQQTTVQVYVISPDKDIKSIVEKPNFWGVGTLIKSTGSPAQSITNI